MPYNGFGTFTLPAGNPVVTGTTISSTINNNTNNDLANGLSNAVTRNGQSPPTTNLPMGNFKLTGLTAGTTSGDSVRYDEFLIVQTALAALIPSGTRMPFAQAAAPTGWTQDITDNATNRMLRVVNTVGGGVAGTDSPILNNTVPSHTHVFTGTAMGNHTHTDSGHAHGGVMRNVGYTGAGYVVSGTYYSTPGSTDVASAAISSNSAGTPAGTNAANAGAANWAPRYIDMIICSKT
jgi:hypothetical protein